MSDEEKLERLGRRCFLPLAILHLIFLLLVLWSNHEPPRTVAESELALQSSRVHAGVSEP